MDTAGVKSLLGLCLAGGYLSYCRRPAKSFVRATFASGIRDREFLEEKVAELRQFVPTKGTITPYQTATRESGNRTTVLRFRLSSSALRPIYNLLYPSGEREITRPALELLGGRAAAWLWAEGCRIGPDGALLSHVGSLQDESLLVAGWLELLTGASPELVTTYARPRLHFDPGQTRLAQQALLPYAPQSRRHLFLPA